MNKVQFVSYTEKSFVVVGDTKPIKDILKSAGGKFNARLVNPATKTNMVGWVFAKARQNSLADLLRGNNVMVGIEISPNISDQNASDYVDAQENAYFDNFCQRNGI